MGSTVKTFQSNVFQSDVYSTSYVIPNSFQGGVFQGNVFQSGFSLKKIIEETLNILRPNGYQGGIFDPVAYQSAVEAVSKIVKLIFVSENVAIQSFRGRTQQLARIIDESLGISEAIIAGQNLKVIISEIEGIGTYLYDVLSREGIKDSTIKNTYRSTTFRTYISKIALYNEFDEMIMIASFPQPMQKLIDQQMVIKVQMDY